MHRSIPIALSVISLGAPALVIPAEASAATKSYSASTTDKYGKVTVTIRVSGKKLKAVTASATAQDARSQQLDSYAISTLKSEALKAGSYKIHTVSSATYTSNAFISSLHAALHKAHID